MRDTQRLLHMRYGGPGHHALIAKHHHFRSGSVVERLIYQKHMIISRIQVREIEPVLAILQFLAVT